MLEKRDDDKERNESAKNTFETLIYEFRGFLNEDENAKYVEEKAREEHIEKTRAEEEWLDDAGSDAGYKAYQDRAYDMRTKYSKIKNLKLAHEAREEIVPRVVENLKRWSDTLDDVTAAKPWITEEEKKDLLDKITETNKWL